jgi:3-methyladenine DNA glycosylase AlkD
MKVIKKGTATKKSVSPKLTANEFISKLISLSSRTDSNLRFFHDQNSSNKGLGIRMAKLFAAAKQFYQMPLNEVEKLLANDYYEVRLGAVSIMDFQARDKKATPERRKDLFNLYIKRHDRINNWDLVDRSAPYVVGGYLFDKPRTILYKLAKSKNIWERRTAIVSTYFFIRQNEINDTFKIAEILVNDKEDLINKAVGSWIREAGKRDPLRLIEFLDEHSPTMPRVTLRYAIEKLDKKQRDYYLKASKN